MPSFAIEVEGQATPLSRQSVLSTLQSASGGTAKQQSLTVATQQLGNWEKTATYYPLLQDIYADSSLGQEIRFQAIIQLKNGIDKHWRKTAINPIAKDDKLQIRSRAIQAGVLEPVPAIALQNALMLAKIVRYEFPQDWPTAISDVIGHLRTATQAATDARQVSNILTITLQIIKELASGKLQRTKRSLQQVSLELLHVLGGLYITLVDRWSNTSDSFDAHASQNSHSALKTLRRLLVVGFEHPHREEDVKQLWSVTQQHHARFWQIITATNQPDVHSIAIKHLLQLSKLYLQTARAHPASFVLMDSMEILHRSWSIVNHKDAKLGLLSNFDWKVYRNGDSEEDDPTEKLALKALLLFRACVKMVFNPVQTFKYQTPQDKDDRKTTTTEIKTKVFTNDFVVQLMEILVTQYFVLRPQDLRDWEQEPDEWERREEEIADAWEFSIRSCSEKLFLDLIINFKELLVPRLLDVFRRYATIENTDVLLKDSLYSAIGIAAACLDDVFDFNSFLRNTLVPEVQMSSPNYNLMRRRTAILLAQWVPIKPNDIDRVAVYQIYKHLMGKDDNLNDHVVRVTAGRQFRLILEPFEFKYEDFAPFATPILSDLMTLTSETELSETKMALLETVRVAVTKLEGHIEPYANGIMTMLPPLWEESGEEHLMKQAILTMITAIVNSLGQKSLCYHTAVLQLIRDSVQPDAEAIVYLLEEALDLWAAIMSQTPSKDPDPSPQLLDLSASLLPLLGKGSELLRQVFELVESYTILSPTTILAPAFLNPLLNSMKDLLPMLSSSRARDASLAPHVVENLIATLTIPGYFDSSPSQAAIQHLLTAMVNSSYLSNILAILHEAYDYHQDPRPNRKPPDIIGPGETSLLTLLARLTLSSPPLFISALAAASPTGDPLAWLIPEWLSQFDSIGDILRKKLQTLAITSLFTSSTPPPTIMLENLQSIIALWTDVITELGEEATEESQGDYLWSTRPNEIPEWPDATPEDGRKRIVSYADAIYTVNVRHYVVEVLRQVMQGWSGQPATFEQEWLSRVDGVVIKGFVELGLPL